MSRPTSSREANEAALMRGGYALLGVILLASAALALDAALEHMDVLGAICGAVEHPHCGWCYAAAALALAALSAFAAALRPSRAAAKARAD